MGKKLWDGRFEKGVAREVEKFTASIPFDIALIEYDIEGSLAHVAMLAACSIISTADGRKISSGLKKIRDEYRRGAFTPSVEAEDVHMAVEARLAELIGPVAGKLHTARSRNDQVSLDVRLYMRDQICAICDAVRALQKSIVVTAKKNSDLVIPEFTHLQHAQPVLLAHHCLAYVEMLERDIGRLTDCLGRVNVMPLGSGACAGTGLSIDRKKVAELLGFKEVARNSIDAVSDRDFVLEFLGAAAILGVHLSRMAEEIILWASREFSFVAIDASYCTGSSMMPQKANPDVAELVRGKSGRLVGSLVAVLTMMKGLPLAYNRDMQEDKEPLFDAVRTVKDSCAIMAGLWSKLAFKPEAIAAAMHGDFSQATDLAEYLVEKGMPFREAHRVVGTLVAWCLRKKRILEEVTIDELRDFSPLFEKEALPILSTQSCVTRKKSYGSTAPARIKREMSLWCRRLGVE